MPLPETTAVDVWTVALDVERPAILLPEEEARAAKFRFDRDRCRWRRARSALRSILSEYLNAAPLSFRFTEGPHGKPSVKGAAEFSLSHSDEWAMIAVTAGVPVGIDLERVRADVDIARLLHRIGETPTAGPVEELFQIWTRREARTKAVGGPLMENPQGDLRVTDLIAPAGFMAAIALLGYNPRISYRGTVPIVQIHGS